MSVTNAELPVVVVGAGPVGLATAAHLHARGISPLVFEAGPRIGHNLLTFAHVQLFSPWRYNVDRVSSSFLSRQGWIEPNLEQLPTAGEVVAKYLQPLAQALASYVHLSHRVTAIARHGVDKVKTAARERAPFLVRVATNDGEREFLAQAVIDASGTWSQPNPLGANGLLALGEHEFRDQIAYGMPDVLGANRSRYAGKRVLVVGAGHSAAGNLIALAQLAEEVPTTQIFWAIRGDNWKRILGGGAADALPARGQLGARLKQLKDSGRLQVHTLFRTHELRRDNGRITVFGSTPTGETTRVSGIEEIIAATGARPDHAITRELRTRWDHWIESTEALAPLIDPNEHSCGTVRPHGHRELAHPEPGFYSIGAKSYGRAPTFLLATGYEQARSVVAAIAGDLTAADDVQLDLPETGVCNVSFGDPAAKADCSTGACQPSAPALAPTTCCGGPPKEGSDACCVKDERAKAAGEEGCGCGSKAASSRSESQSACCA